MKPPNNDREPVHYERNKPAKKYNTRDGKSSPDNTKISPPPESAGYSYENPEMETLEDRFNELIEIGRHTSHQLNNLLTTILTNSQLVLLIGKDEESESLLGAIEKAARDAGRILLNFQECVHAFSRDTSRSTGSKYHGNIFLKREKFPHNQAFVFLPHSAASHVAMRHDAPTEISRPFGMLLA